MKKQCLSVVLTLTCLLSLGLGARAQASDAVVTNVPFEFVAGGVTLPAGTYSVSRVSSDWDSQLLIRDGEHSVFLLPTAFQGSLSENAVLSFKHVGSQYFLSKIKTPTGVYSVPAPRALNTVAKKKATDGMESSGTN
jgi:hypothetical protein